jgi:hypothetical protein
VDEEDEAIRNMIISICEELYEPMNDGRYFLVEGKSSEEVEAEILAKMEPKYAKCKYLYAYAYICGITDEVLIRID